MISVLVVDDSVVIRRMVADVLGAEPGIRVVGTAPNGKLALAKIDQLAPDLVTLDVEMPVLDGVSTVRELRKTHPRLPVIMFSTLTSIGADATLAALAAGASDYVTKPANVGSITESIASVRQQLVPRIHALCERPKYVAPFPRPTRPTGPPGGTAKAAAPNGRPTPRTISGKVDAIVIGSSTGGPEALHVVLTSLPADLPVPVFVVQHMPPVFTSMLAKRLDAACKVHVVEAETGTPVRPGTVYLAPGDFHLEIGRVAGEVRTRLSSAPPENHCRPAVDVLFRSAAQAYGGNLNAVVLTGMGQDGKRGAEVLRARGARITAQDQASSVVWGMPGAVTEAGLADSVLPLRDIAAHIVAQLADRSAAPQPEVTK